MRTNELQGFNTAKKMTEVGTRDLPLKWDVFVTPGMPTVTSDLPPGAKQQMWSPTSSTLIYGKRDAVLVDAFITVEQADALVDWVAASGKNLTTIYATHGHGDHFFGIGALLDRFPSARAVVTRDVVKLMRQQASPDVVANFWSARFPDQIPERLIADELEGNVIDLEGHDLVVVELGHTDTDYTTCLHVPSVGLVNPRVVIAGYKRPGNDDSPKIIEETRQYIRDFDQVAGTTTTARELYDKMLELYPDRVNPGGALWISARALKP